MIRHFYHVFAGGAWAEPVREHAAALAESGFSGQVTVGVIGPASDRRILRDVMGALLRPLPVEADWIEADTGFEKVTLDALRSWAIQAPDSQPVLYAHTKGAHDLTDWNTAWRRSMTRRVVGGWRDCVRLLTEGWDTVGCHWLTPERDHNPPDYLVPGPFYGGNFWWAQSSYLRSLPVVGTADRHDSELWIGCGHPRAYDLLPGWPSMDLCAA